MQMEEKELTEINRYKLVHQFNYHGGSTISTEELEKNRLEIVKMLSANIKEHNYTSPNTGVKHKYIQIDDKRRHVALIASGCAVTIGMKGEDGNIKIYQADNGYKTFTYEVT